MRPRETLFLVFMTFMMYLFIQMCVRSFDKHEFVIDNDAIDEVTDFVEDMPAEVLNRAPISFDVFDKATN